MEGEIKNFIIRINYSVEIWRKANQIEQLKKFDSKS